MIKLDALSCKLTGKTILNKISLTIPNHLCILGANGSGKSTLAKSICNLTTYDGTITINNTNIQEMNLKEKAKTISYIPAKLEVFDIYISVFEFILLGRFPYKKSFYDYSQDDKDIALQTLTFLKIQHLQEHTVSSLSSGEQQLVLIAQALSQQSTIIILDEPTANLDPKNSKIIAKHIKELKQKHQIILITHDLNLAHYIDVPIAFLKNSMLNYYENNFFNDHTLKELYDVEFNALAVKYE